MSDIDIERLEHDREYWDNVAPDGATHVANRRDKQPKRPFAPCWYKYKYHEARFYYMYPENSEWEICPNGDPVHEPLIPRPEPKPRWNGEGLPTVGVECEGYVLQPSGQGAWVVVEVLKHHTNNECAVYVPSMGVLRWCDQFRPLLSHEQRQRKELEAIIESQTSLIYPRPIADAILAAGFTKPPEQPNPTAN